MTEIQETQEIPKWLKELEEKREKRLKARLGHEAGAGSPCLTCIEKCPGLDLHFWRKICKNCKCGKESHDVHDDDIYGWAQFQLLGSKPDKPRKIVLPGKKEEVELEWTPKGHNDTVESYLKDLPQHLLPIKGSAAAQERKQLLQKQIPLHDIDPTLCHALSENEVKQMNDYIAHIKQNSVGVGHIIKLSQLMKGRVHDTPKSQAHILANRISAQLPNTQPVHLQGSDWSSILRGKNTELSHKLQDLCIQENKNIDPVEDEQRFEDNIGKMHSKRVELNFIPTIEQQNSEICNHVRDINYPAYSTISSEKLQEALDNTPLFGDSQPLDTVKNLESKLSKLPHYLQNKLVNFESIQKPLKTNLNDIYPSNINISPLSSKNYVASDSQNNLKSLPYSVNSIRASLDPYNKFYDNNVNVPPANYTSVIQKRNLKNLSEKSPEFPHVNTKESHSPTNKENYLNKNSNVMRKKEDALLPPIPPLPECYKEEEQVMSLKETKNIRPENIENYTPGKFNTIFDNRNPQNIEHLRDMKYPTYSNNRKLPQDYLNEEHYKNITPSTTLPGSLKNESSNIKYPTAKHPALPQDDIVVPNFEEQNMYFPYQQNASVSPYKGLASEFVQSMPSAFSKYSSSSSIAHNKPLTSHVPQNNSLDSNTFQATSPILNYSPNKSIPRDENTALHSAYNKTLTEMSFPQKDVLSENNPSGAQSAFAHANKPVAYNPNELSIPENLQKPTPISIGSIYDIEYPVNDIKHASHKQNNIFEACLPPSLPENYTKLPECHRCKKMFEDNSNVIGIERTDALWHAECFKCAGCNQNLADWLYFYHKENDNIYCGRDYAKIKGIPRCKACDELIFVKEYCLAENNTFHIKHFCCFVCDEPLAGKNYVMEDSQPHCLPCFEKLKAEHCNTCMNIIKPDQAGANLNGIHFHADDTCFSCLMCQKPLLGSKFLFKNQKLYCSVLCFGTDKK